MPKISNRKLTITPRLAQGEPDGAHSVIEITYRVVFSRFERKLVGLGLKFREIVSVFGADPPGSTTSSEPDLLRFVETLNVTPGDLDQVIERRHVEIVDNRSLDEDPGTISLDDDEIRCRIEIEALGIPPAVTRAFTNEVILFETGPAQPSTQQVSD